MKKIAFTMILFLAFCLLGCNVKQNTEGEEEIELHGFYGLDEAPRATGKHELEEITKIMFTDWNVPNSKESIVINIGEKGLFFNKRVYNGIDTRQFDYIMTESDISEILEVLDKYDVMNWSNLYGKVETIHEEPGVLSEGPRLWILALQFSDGTVKYIKGYYNGEDKFPDDLDLFVQELAELVASKKPEEPQWEEVEGSSYVIENFVGEQVRISLQSDIEEGYTLATKVEDGEEQFAIMKDGELCSRGFFTFRENIVSKIENYETHELYKNYNVFEVSNEEYPRYIYYSILTDKLLYNILYDETSAGVMLVNEISEESAQDIFERVTFERVEE